MQKHSNCLIFRLFGRYPSSQNGLICVYLFLIFGSLPYTVAQNKYLPPTMVYTGTNYPYNPRQIIITIVIFIVFFLLFFIYFRIYRRNQAGRERSIGRNVAEGQIQSKGNQGLDPTAIEAFPIFSYLQVKDYKSGNGALECAVCLNEFKDDDTIRLLPKCDHVFHAECIDAWLSSRTTCPVCRANLIPEDTENEQVSVTVMSEEPQAVAVALEVINQTPMQNRPARLIKPGYVSRLQRFHSTGYSLVQPEDKAERFTLRLPEDVRKQIMSMRQLNQTASMVAVPVSISPRNLDRTSSEGSSREGKSMRKKPEGWVLSMTRSFLMGASSLWSLEMMPEANAPATSPRPKTVRLLKLESI